MGHYIYGSIEKLNDCRVIYSTMAKILVVEDDKALRTTIVDTLEFDRHTVESVDSGDDALARLAASDYDLLVLDVHLPVHDGIEICKTYRARGGTSPVLFLTARNTISDKEQGFTAGCDDYLTKPFHVKELSLRTQALLKRGGSEKTDVLKIRDLELNRQTYSVCREGKDLGLSRMEFALLEFLMRNANQVFSAEAIISRVWPSESERSPDTLRTAIKKLRDKIDKAGEPSLIKNMHGIGYKFESNG